MARANLTVAAPETPVCVSSNPPSLCSPSTQRAWFLLRSSAYGVPCYNHRLQQGDRLLAADPLQFREARCVYGIPVQCRQYAASRNLKHRQLATERRGADQCLIVPGRPTEQPADNT